MDLHYLFNFHITITYKTEKDVRIKHTDVKLANYDPVAATDIAIARMYANKDISAIEDIVKIRTIFYDVFISDSETPWKIDVLPFLSESDYSIENETYKIL